MRGVWMSMEGPLTPPVGGIVTEEAAEVLEKESKPEMRATYADDEDFPRRILIFHVS